MERLLSGRPAPDRHSPGATRRGPGLDRDTVSALLEQYRSTGDRKLRNRVVEAHLHLVEHYVARHTRRGVASADDLRQTAMLALIGAVDRFDPTAGASLSTFATRTIDGELKRYLRDKTWIVRPPRSAQEAHLDTRRASEELAHSLGRSPTVPELAAHLAVDVERVIVGLVAGQARSGDSLDRPAGDDDDRQRVRTVVANEERGYERVDSAMTLRDGVARLDRRQRQIIEMRFGHEMSQPQIAEAIGVSQSYVSRIIDGAVAVLRADFVEQGSDT